MKTFRVMATGDGGFHMSDYQNKTLRQFVKDHAGHMVRITIAPEVPESKKQRAFYHGAVLPLWAYLDNNDYRDSKILDYYHQNAKLEFNPEIIVIGGEAIKVGKSTVGELNNGFIERVVDNLVENYGIDPIKVLNTDLYKKFRDTIYPSTDEYDTFIDYMKALRLV